MKTRGLDLLGPCREHCPHDGAFKAERFGLTFYRASQPQELICGVATPSIGVVVQGAKSVRLGRRTVRYGLAEYLLVTADLPVISYATEATSEEPYLGLGIELDPTLIWDVMASERSGEKTDYAASPGLAVQQLTTPLWDALSRLLRHLRSPRDSEVLGTLVLKEIVYLLLQSPNSAALHRLAIGETKSSAMRAIRWLKKNYDLRFKVEQLAEEVGVSRSALHQQFKELTHMSPLQYQKCLRLQEARRRLLSSEASAAEVSYQVGYSSPSQFGREYKRLFGASPQRDVQQLRAALPRSVDSTTSWTVRL